MMERYAHNLTLEERFLYLSSQKLENWQDTRKKKQNNFPDANIEIVFLFKI